MSNSADGHSAATGVIPRRLLPWLVAVAFFMESLDTTILNTAVPTIAQALGVAPLSMKAVLASYTLSLAVFIPISGWMANRFGTRRVFASAIGVFTLGSFLCGISSDIHLLVACRMLQGCGGAMMVPVGRLTLVRTFAKSELIRAMSFVAIPGLVGPMLGPLAGGLIVGYFHWSVIFFVNIPIGLVGLFLVYRHLPDYREERTSPLDYRRPASCSAPASRCCPMCWRCSASTRLSGREISGCWRSPRCCSPATGCTRCASRFPLLRLTLFRHPHLPRGGQRQLLHAAGHRRHAVSAAAAVPGRPGLHADPVGPADHAAGARRDEPQVHHAAHPDALRLPRRADLEHRASSALLILLFATIGARHAGLADRVAGVRFGFFTSLQYTSMNTLVYADVTEQQTSSASTIASTMQQMAMSFGVAPRSLATAFFMPDSVHAQRRPR